MSSTWSMTVVAVTVLTAAPDKAAPEFAQMSTVLRSTELVPSDIRALAAKLKALRPGSPKARELIQQASTLLDFELQMGPQESRAKLAGQLQQVARLYGDLFPDDVEVQIQVTDAFIEARNLAEMAGLDSQPYMTKATERAAASATRFKDNATAQEQYATALIASGSKPAEVIPVLERCLKANPHSELCKSQWGEFAKGRGRVDPHAN